MNRETRKLYNRFRAAGETAKRALESARVVRQFEALEAAGFVRIDVQPDESPDLSWLDQDCFNDTRGARAATKKMREQIERDGVWGTVGEYRLEDDAEWAHADSCWGHTGYNDVASPFENAYVIDHMAATIEAFKLALRERFCQHCGHRRVA
jgi:hypothetical protein